MSSNYPQPDATNPQVRLEDDDLKARRAAYREFQKSCLGVPFKYGDKFGSIRVRAHVSIIDYLKTEAHRNNESMQKTVERIMLFHFRDRLEDDLAQGVITTQGKYTPRLRVKKTRPEGKSDSQLTYEELKEKYSKKNI